MLAFILCLIIGGVISFVFIMGCLWYEWEWIERIPSTAKSLVMAISSFVLLLGLWGLFNILEVQQQKNEKFLEATLERQVLEEALKNEDLKKNDAFKIRLDKFNDNLKKQKTWSGNIWFGMIYNDKIATIDYIVYPD